MKNKLSIFIWWFFWIIYLEIIYKIFVMQNLLTINTLYVLAFSIPWIILFTILTSFFGEKVNKFLCIVFSLILAFITLAQIVYFNFYNSIFSFFSLTTGTGQVLHFWKMILEVIGRIWYIFVLVLVPLILFLIFHNKIFNFKNNSFKKFLLFLITGIVFIFSIICLIKFDNKGIYSLNKLILSTHAPMLTINKTGLFSMQAIDLYRYLFGFSEKDLNIEENNPIEAPAEEKIEYNELDIDFDNLINNESNSKIIKIHKYFNSINPTEKNNYTGLFKNKNLIFITAEAFDKIAIDENITPTLYKMANNSFVFNNYYQPLYPVSTSDGEYMNLLSLIPKEGVWSFSKTSKLSMPFAPGNLFKKNDYETYAFHNHNYKYYDRHKSHKNIGFTYYGCGNGLEKEMNCRRWPNSDDEMFKSTTKYYVNNQPFLVYYMTVSGHLNYNFYGNNMAYKHKNEVKGLKYSEAVRAYYATQIELDIAMQHLLEELEEKQLLDDTLILIAPDHYPYGLKKTELNEVSEINRDDKFELYHTALIMYNPKIEKTVIDKTISSLDILPTIYNLYGIDFDSRLLMGKDIFSDDEHIVILSDRSWITDKGKYNSVNGKFVGTTNEDVNQEYIDKINEIVSQKFSISSLILDNDYYAHLEIKHEN